MNEGEDEVELVNIPRWRSSQLLLTILALLIQPDYEFSDATPKLLRQPLFEGVHRPAQNHGLR